MIQLLVQHTSIEVALREIDVFPTEENKDGRLKANINIRTVGRINFFTVNRSFSIFHFKNFIHFPGGCRREKMELEFQSWLLIKEK